MFNVNHNEALLNLLVTYVADNKYELFRDVVEEQFKINVDEINEITKSDTLDYFMLKLSGEKLHEVEVAIISELTMRAKTLLTNGAVYANLQLKEA